MFGQKELDYLREQPLARLATTTNEGQPDVDAVGFEFDGTHFYIGGANLPASRKYKNVAAGNKKVSLIIDDLASTNPWSPRGIKIHGQAEIVERPGRFGPAAYIQIQPTTTWSWGVEDEPVFQNGKFTPHKTVWV